MVGRTSHREKSFSKVYCDSQLPSLQRDPGLKQYLPKRKRELERACIQRLKCFTLVRHYDLRRKPLSYNTSALLINLLQTNPSYNELNAAR
jgi:hypothetical protein